MTSAERQRRWRKENPGKARAQHARWAAKYPEKKAAITKAWREKNPVKVRLYRIRAAAKTRAERKGIEFTLTKEWIEERFERCEMSGIEFDMSGGAAGPRTPSIDRIDNSKGYTPDNCRVICLALNTAFGTWGEEEFAEIWQKHQEQTLLSRLQSSKT